MIRKIKREMLKRELKTNDISVEFHKRYGYKSNISSKEIKLKDRLLKKLRKLAHKRARNKKSKGSEILE